MIVRLRDRLGDGPRPMLLQSDETGKTLGCNKAVATDTRFRVGITKLYNVASMHQA